MKTKKRIILVSVLIILLTASGCGGKDENADDTIATSVAATQAVAAMQTEQAVSDVEEQVPEEPTAEPVVHTMIPDGPSGAIDTYLTDFNSLGYADEDHTYGDQYLINRYERPFTVEMEEYRGYLDIILANMKVEPPWIYVDVYFAQELEDTGQAWYGLEFDVDIDNRGDFLVFAPLPVSTDWSAEGAAVYEDLDGDIGGNQPHLPDEVAIETTGYENALLVNGEGDDPDLVWIRRNPDDQTSLQLAVKSDLIGTGGFLWSVWADEGMQSPEMQEYNDSYDFETAGSPYPEHVFHPIQAIHLIDSTCISWFGYEPTGDEIGLCQVFVEKGPEKGWKICYTIGNTVVCSTECMVNCPPGLLGGLFCRRCNLPSD